MDKILFDNLQIKEAYNVLERISAEMDECEQTMRMLSENLQEFSRNMRFEEDFLQWRRDYEKSREQISMTIHKLKQVEECYEKTEQKNLLLVEELSSRDAEFGIGKTSYMPGGWKTNPLKRMYRGQPVTINSMLSDSRMQHEAWVLQAVENILEESL